MTGAIGLCFGGERVFIRALMKRADDELGTCWGSLKPCMRILNIGLYSQSPKSGKDPIKPGKEIMSREEGADARDGVLMIPK